MSDWVTQEGRDDAVSNANHLVIHQIERLYESLQQAHLKAFMADPLKTIENLDLAQHLFKELHEMCHIWQCLLADEAAHRDPQITELAKESATDILKRLEPL